MAGTFSVINCKQNNATSRHISFVSSCLTQKPVMCSVAIFSGTSIFIELDGNANRFLPVNRLKGLFGEVCTVLDAAQLSGLWQENLLQLKNQLKLLVH